MCDAMPGSEAIVQLSQKIYQRVGPRPLCPPIVAPLATSAVVVGGRRGRHSGAGAACGRAL